MNKDPDVRRGYAPVPGLRGYYEVHGTGQPRPIVAADLSAGPVTAAWYQT